MKKNQNKALPGGLWLLKNQLTIKLTVVLLFLSSLAVTAQNVTIRMKNSSFTEITKEIQKQTSLTFLYNDSKVGTIKNLNPDFTNADVKTVLEYCLNGTGLTFSIVDNTVVITPVRENQQNDRNRLRVTGRIIRREECSSSRREYPDQGNHGRFRVRRGRELPGIVRQG